MNAYIFTGASMAQHAGKHLHKYITRRSEYKAGNIVQAIQEGFLELDKAMQDDVALKEEPAGTTVIALLVKDNVLYSVSRISFFIHIYIYIFRSYVSEFLTAEETLQANAGDSRAVASINGRAVPLSRDHKPTLKDERARIEAAGGYVEYKRVNGNLALSRALGDFMFKRNDHKSPQEQIVTGK